MPKVRIKVEGGICTPENRNSLLSLLCASDIRVRKCFDAFESYRVIVETERDVKKPFEPAVMTKLTTKGFTPVLSPDQRAKLTLVLKGLDTSILEMTPDELKASIEQNDPNAKIEDVFIMKWAYLVKVRFATMEMANKIKNAGLRVGYFSIPTSQIEFERYVAVPQCTNCHKYDHTKKDCPRKNETICSECSAVGHTFRSCPSKDSGKKVCPNCAGDHRAISGKCEKRKEAIKLLLDKKEEKEQEKTNKPYNEAAQRAVQASLTATKEIVKETVAAAKAAPSPPTQILQLPDDMSYKIWVIMIDAHIRNTRYPGTYSDEVNKGLKHAGLPQVPLRPVDSAQLFSIVRQVPSPTPVASPISPLQQAAATFPSQESVVSETPSHDRALDNQLDQLDQASGGTGNTENENEMEIVAEDLRGRGQHPSFGSVRSKSKPHRTKSNSRRRRSHSRPATPTAPTRAEIPSDPAILGITLYAVKPQQFSNWNKHQLGREIRCNNIKFQYSNATYSSAEDAQRIYTMMVEGDMELNPHMIYQTSNNKFRNIRNDYRQSAEDAKDANSSGGLQ